MIDLTSRRSARATATSPLLARVSCAALVAVLAWAAPAPGFAGEAFGDSPQLSDAQVDALYGAAKAIGSLQVSYWSKGFNDRAAADDAFERMARDGKAGAERMAFHQAKDYLFALPAAARLALLNTVDGQPAGPLQMDGKWWVFLRTGIANAPMPALTEVRKQLPSLVHIGALPSPEELAAGPASTAFKALAVRDAAGLDKLPQQFNLNMVLPNGITMLISALLRQDTEFAGTLLGRGANPNKCSAGLCPLHAALLGQERGAAAIKLLLDHGADPDVLDRQAGLRVTPLAAAMLDNLPEISQMLLQAGADVNGKDGDITPLMFAASRADRDAVRLLDQHHADWLRTSRTLPPYNVLSFAAKGGKTNGAFNSWLAAQYQKAAARTGRLQWDAWVEQDGKKWHVGEAPITLARKPFNIVVALREGASLMVATGTSGEVFKELERGYGRGRIFSVAAVCAETRDGTSRFLAVNHATGGGDPYVIQSWNYTEQSKSFSAVRATRHAKVYVRRIDELLDQGKSRSITASGVPRLYMVLGTQLDMAFPTFDYFAHKRLELRFN